jgi:hypothetical protein
MEWLHKNSFYFFFLLLIIGLAVKDNHGRLIKIKQRQQAQERGLPLQRPRGKTPTVQHAVVDHVLQGLNLDEMILLRELLGMQTTKQRRQKSAAGGGRVTSFYRDWFISPNDCRCFS